MSSHASVASAFAIVAAVFAVCLGNDAVQAARSTSIAGESVMQDATSSDSSEGRRVFRFETFGDEQFWTEKARLHEVISESISPKQALAVGLKVDAEALPDEVVAGIRDGTIDLADPATTVALLKLDAVLGVKGTVKTENGKDRLVSVGITCALCHSTVDDSFSKGIGRRHDGWPNRDLDVGAIIALSPAIPDAQKAIYTSWGKGKYDPRFNIDGLSTPLVLPPAYGLAGVKNETLTADGPISYWNAYVAVTQMHGQGEFKDERLGIAVHATPDLVTPLLPALRDYQLSLTAPRPPEGSFDPAAAVRGKKMFELSCARCHVGATGTDNNAGVLHAPAETGMNGDYAARTVNKAHRTTPLRGLWQHPPYFHDGSADSLVAVVAHYDRIFELNLTAEQKGDLVEYLKSL